MPDAWSDLPGRLALAALLLGLAAAPARAQEEGLPMPRLRPPPRHETIPPAPGRSYEWAPGAWRWNGSFYIWTRGRYMARRPWTHRWIKGHAEGTGNGLEKWVPGFYGEPRRRDPTGQPARNP
jgi:hypothetical protein